MDQNVRKKLNEIRQKQLESGDNFHTNKPYTTASDNSLRFAALGGLATGFIIAWIMNSFLPTENANLIAQKSRVVIYENEIREANKSIERLNDRVELLTGSISTLESELRHAIGFLEPNKINEKSTSADQEPAEPANEITPYTPTGSQTSGATDSASANETAFIPTHVVKTRLNIRTSTSLDDAPIGVLSTGTKVSYIDEADDWYYIDTEQLGKGWCASKFLSPLSSP